MTPPFARFPGKCRFESSDTFAHFPGVAAGPSPVITSQKENNENANSKGKTTMRKNTNNFCEPHAKKALNFDNSMNGFGELDAGSKKYDERYNTLSGCLFDWFSQ